MTEGEIYRLDDLIVDLGARRILRGSEDIPLSKRSFDLLAALLHSYPNAASVDELMSRVWGRAVVNPSTVAKRVQLLRKALGDDHGDPHYVTLVRGHGYRLEVEPLLAGRDTPAPDVPTPRAGLKMLAAGAVFVVAASLFFIGQGDSTRPGAVHERSVAVLPFVSLSEAPEDQLFADGLTEEIIHALANHSQLKVTGRTSAFFYKDRDADLRDIGRTLGVAHVLEGSMRREGDQLRITAQLIETESGFHLWSEAYDRPLANVVDIQQDIARNIAAAFRASLDVELPVAPDLPDPEHHASYLKALHLTKASHDGDATPAQAILEELLYEEPEYAPAWILLAQYHARRLLGNHEHYSYSWQESWDRIRHAVGMALRHGPESGDSRLLQGTIEWRYKNDPAAAAVQFEKALALAPGDLDVVQGVARFARHIGRFDVALPLQQYAVDRDPLCTSCLYYLARTYWYLRRYDEAEQAIRKYQSMAGGAEQSLGLTLLLGGKPGAALESFRELDHHLYLSLQGEVMSLHDLGEAEAATNALRRLESDWGEQAPLSVAQAHAYLGQSTEAFHWLARLDRRGRDDLRTDFLDPLFDTLRQDPRWDAILAGVGAAPERLAAVEFAPDLSRFLAPLPDDWSSKP